MRRKAVGPGDRRHCQLLETAQRPKEVIPRPVLCRMVCDLLRLDWAPDFPDAAQNGGLSEPFEIAQQLVVGPVSRRLASRRVHFVENGLL